MVIIIKYFLNVMKKIIDDIDFILPKTNYILIENVKKQIIIGNTFNHDMRHIIGWRHRYNGKYLKTAPFTIDRLGVIHKHFDPKYQSKYFNDLVLDGRSIVILLENDGWLTLNSEKNNFISWVGDIYSESDSVVEKKWRGYRYWAPYSEEQMIATINLVQLLCKEFSIPIVAVSHNTKIDNISDYEGIMYKSNITKYYNDLNPSWDFDQFNEKL